MAGVSSHPSITTVNNGNNLSILYYNARSILPKHDELRLVVEVNNPDIICIVESWLGHDVRDQEIAILNHYIFRHDRNRHGGGILIYVKDTYITSVLPGVPTDLEIITICVQSGNCKACLSLFY